MQFSSIFDDPTQTRIDFGGGFLYPPGETFESIVRDPSLVAKSPESAFFNEPTQ